MDAGLRSVADYLKVRHGYAQISAGYGSATGFFGRGEIGARFSESISAFGYGQVDQKAGFHAGIGARWTFDF